MSKLLPLSILAIGSVVGVAFADENGHTVKYRPAQVETATPAPEAPTKVFHYADRVRVTSGFYVGLLGKVTYQEGYDQYEVFLIKPERWVSFKSRDLELIK